MDTQMYREFTKYSYTFTPDRVDDLLDVGGHVHSGGHQGTLALQLLEQELDTGGLQREGQ